MKNIELVKVEHSYKVGQECPDLMPNVTEDAIFLADGQPIGFYKRNLTGRLAKLLDLANHELNSDRVPKSMLSRSSELFNRGKGVKQYSTILGSCPAKPHFKRPYPSMSSVHDEPTANVFVMAMLELCKEAELLIREVCPELYDRQLRAIAENVPDQWKFGQLFTSSISNCNISAGYHIDHANIRDTVNVIFYKKKQASGGHLHLPDYDVVIEAEDLSVVVYPAWRDMHGVTPIHVYGMSGYRNSLIFYPLRGFNKYQHVGIINSEETESHGE